MLVSSILIGETAIGLMVVARIVRTTDLARAPIGQMAVHATVAPTVRTIIVAIKTGTVRMITAGSNLPVRQNHGPLFPQLPHHRFNRSRLRSCRNRLKPFGHAVSNCAV
ncbi:hypothetical protein GCM10027347_30510 [Larkinella harenae]